MFPAIRISEPSVSSHLSTFAIIPSTLRAPYLSAYSARKSCNSLSRKLYTSQTAIHLLRNGPRSGQLVNVSKTRNVIGYYRERSPWNLVSEQISQRLDRETKRIERLPSLKGLAIRHERKVVWPKVQSDFSLRTTGKSRLIRRIREHFRELSGSGGFAKCRAIMELYLQSQLHRGVSDRQWCLGPNSYLIHNDVLQRRRFSGKNGESTGMSFKRQKRR